MGAPKLDEEEGRLVYRRADELPQATPEDLARVREAMEGPIDTSDIPEMMEQVEARLAADESRLPRWRGWEHWASHGGSLTFLYRGFTGRVRHEPGATVLHGTVTARRDAQGWPMAWRDAVTFRVDRTPDVRETLRALRGAFRRAVEEYLDITMEP